MKKRKKITDAGQDAVDKFCEITGAIEADKSNDKRGDVFFLVDGEKLWVEIKEFTLNQVRVYKGIPLVAPIPIIKDKAIVGWNKDQWLYMSPVDQTQQCLKNDGSGMKAGQHAMFALQCASMGFAGTQSFGKRVHSSELKQIVLNGFQEFEPVRAPFEKYITGFCIDKKIEVMKEATETTINFLNIVKSPASNK
jgi:hypothetical protein